MGQSPPERPDEHIAREREQLATMLALMLLITFGGAFLLFLIFVSLGLFFWVLVIGAAIAAYGGLHYVVWGRPSRGIDEENDESDSTSSSPNWPRELLDRRGRRGD